MAEINTWYDLDWASAEREIRRALELNPDLPDALRADEVFSTLVWLASKYATAVAAYGGA